MKHKYIMCKNCGWVAYQMTRKAAEKAVADFNSYFDTLSKKDKKLYYNNHKAHIEFYEECFRCHESFENFRDAGEDEIPIGCTINPVIKRSKKK